MNTKTISLFLSIFCLMPITAQKKQSRKQCILTVATFNLRMDTPNDGNNAWSHRKGLVNALIRFHDFDIFGTQEGFAHQLHDIIAAGDYARIGTGRDGGSEGEHSAILYKKDRLILLDSGDFWFSETPDKVSKGWDATCCNRVCSWGKFQDRKSGKAFFFFNAHYDHQGHVARRESSKLLLHKINAIAQNTPVISVGDFNATPDTKPIQIIEKSDLLKDAYHLSQQPPYGTKGTFNDFKHNAPLKDRIDYIFATSGVDVVKYGVLNEMPYGKFPSDHFPVMAKVQID